jgi:hypothetical protein
VAGLDLEECPYSEAEAFHEGQTTWYDVDGIIRTRELTAGGQ